MNTYKRHNARWTVNELNSLQREYELLAMSPEEIAERHQRTVVAILYRLKQEGIIDDEARNGWFLGPNCWQQLEVKDCVEELKLQSVCDEEEEEEEDEDEEDEDYQEEDLDDDDDDDQEEDEDEDEQEKFRVEMCGRVAQLEESLFDMKTMIASILKKLTHNSNKKPLRQYLS